jgi:hypothetical protein
MAKTVTFNGQKLRKPGAYSKFNVDNSAGAPIGSNDTIFLIGESTKGAPGSVTGIVEYAAERLNTLIEVYGSGPLVDAAIAAVKPSREPGVSGAGRVQIYKTNAATQGEVDVPAAGGDIFEVKGQNYGLDDNLLSIVLADGTAPATQKTVSITQIGGTTENLGENANQDIITIEYTGDATTSSLTITGAARNAMTLTNTLAGDQTDGSVDLSIPLGNITMKQLVDQIDAQTGYSATLNNVASTNRSGSELDPVSGVDTTSAVVLKRLQLEILDIINGSTRVQALMIAVPQEGLPNNGSFALTGGAQGASTNSNFATGLSNSLAKTYNVALPCVSRDATEDIADEKLGFTDPASTYDVASVIAATESHLRLRGQTKNRKEAQGMGGIRKTTKAAAFSSISGVGSELMQVTMQDCVTLDETGTLAVKMPHVMAAIMAGVRLGTEVGEPLTHKFINVSQIGHIIDPDTLLESGDFNAGLDADDAIDNGVLFAEEAQGGFRIVVDNTTYGRDESFVFNRGSVVEASQFVFKTLRETAELVFVGKKVSNGLAASIKSVVRNKLRELNAPDVQIITSSNDAPEGFREDTFVVTVSGNTARVQVEFKPVQGLDFVLFDFTLGDIQQSA